MMNIFFFFLCVSLTSLAQDISFSVDHAHHNKKSQLILMMIGKETHESSQVAQLIKKALEFKGQCDVTVQ